MKKFLYYCDPMGDEQEEMKHIIIEIENLSGKTISIQYEEQLPLEKSFDVLFFDWGGMSIGNSMLEHFCDYILKDAQEHPSRFYVMTSTFTTSAMRDAISEFGNDKPANILLTVKELIPYLD